MPENSSSNFEPREETPAWSYAHEDSSPEITPQRVLQLAILIEGGMIVVALLGARFLLAKGTLFSSHESLMSALIGMAAGGVLAGIARQLEFLPWPQFQQFCRFVDQQVAPIFTGCTWWQIVVISLLAGVGEEFLFRGLLQQGVQQLVGGTAGWWLGIIVGGVVFGACHALSRMYCILAILGGIYLGVVFALTESLWAAVIAHGLYDLIMLWHLRRRAD